MFQIQDNTPVIVGVGFAQVTSDDPQACPEAIVMMENAIRQEPLLAEKAMRARRVTPVMTYTNYQLLSERGHGPGWVLLGDAFGFVDPMLSPGLFMSLEGARQLADCVFSQISLNFRYGTQAWTKHFALPQVFFLQTLPN